MSTRLDVLLVQVACAEGFPPTINQANLLAEAGLEVGVLDLRHPELTNADLWYPHVRRWHGARQWMSHAEPLPPLPLRAWRHWTLARRLAAVRHRFRPRVEIGYDIVGCRALGVPARSPAFTIWHLHEHPELRDPRSRTARRALSFLRQHAAAADLVVVPDDGRADAMVRDGIVRSRPVVVRNCPRRQEDLPEETLGELLRERGLQGGKAVLYQGTICREKCADVLSSSIADWPDDAILVLLGPAASDTLTQLTTTAESAGPGLSRRIVAVPRVGYDRVLALTCGAQIGLGLVRALGDQWRYSAGAINKRYEYMAAGIPQVANTGHGMDAIIRDTGCGLLVDPESPKALAQAVTRLLADADLRGQMSVSARRAHLEQFNYEKQFQPVMRRIIRSLDEHVRP